MRELHSPARIAFVICVRGRHVEEVWVKELSVERRTWHRDSRVESAPVADPGRAPEKAKLIVMQCQHLLD
jgi:hypothetical protein